MSGSVPSLQCSSLCCYVLLAGASGLSQPKFGVRRRGSRKTSIGRTPARERELLRTCASQASSATIGLCTALPRSGSRKTSIGRTPARQRELLRVPLQGTREPNPKNEASHATGQRPVDESAIPYRPAGLRQTAATAVDTLQRIQGSQGSSKEPHHVIKVNSVAFPNLLGFPRWQTRTEP